MTAVRIESVVEPFVSDPAAAVKGARLVARAEFLGILPDDPAERRELGKPLIEAILRRLASHGVAARAELLTHTAWSTNYDALLDAALEQTEHSPMPHLAWNPLRGILGEDLLADLLNVSTTSLRRYAAGDRGTPEEVAGRLHLLVLLVSDLAGGYNDYGIRRWFLRPRAALGDLTPRDVLKADVEKARFDPTSADARRLRVLAAGLAAGNAT